jgi:hypothetical protein
MLEGMISDPVVLGWLEGRGMVGATADDTRDEVAVWEGAMKKSGTTHAENEGSGEEQDEEPPEEGMDEPAAVLVGPLDRGMVGAIAVDTREDVAVCDGAMKNSGRDSR